MVIRMDHVTRARARKSALMLAHLALHSLKLDSARMHTSCYLKPDEGSDDDIW